MTHENCRAATRKAIETAEKSGALLSFDPNLREPLWGGLEEAKRQIAYGMEHCHVLKASLDYISSSNPAWVTESDSAILPDPHYLLFF